MKTVSMSLVVFLIVVGGAYGAGIVMRFHFWLSLLLLAGMVVLGLIKVLLNLRKKG